MAAVSGEGTRQPAGTAWRRGGFLPLALLAAALLAPGCSKGPVKYPEVRARDAEVVVSLDGVEAGSGRFLTYRAAEGKRVDFFVYRDSAGGAHAVLDACRTCYRWKKGYVRVGDEVVCVKCDMRFKIDGLAQGSGSCVPIQVRSTRRGGSLVIPAAELEAGARYF